MFENFIFTRVQRNSRLRAKFIQRNTLHWYFPTKYSTCVFIIKILFHCFRYCVRKHLFIVSVVTWDMTDKSIRFIRFALWNQFRRAPCFRLALIVLFDKKFIYFIIHQPAVYIRSFIVKKTIKIDYVLLFAFFSFQLTAILIIKSHRITN